MNTPDLDDLLYALQKTAKDSEGGITAIAKKLGRGPNQFAQKLSPQDPTHIPNIGEFIAVMEHTRDTLPLEILCAMFGGQFVTRTAERNDSLAVAALKVESEVGKLSQLIIDAIEDGEIDSGEKVRIRCAFQNIRKMVNVGENSL